MSFFFAPAARKFREYSFLDYKNNVKLSKSAQKSRRKRDKNLKNRLIFKKIEKKNPSIWGSQLIRGGVVSQRYPLIHFRSSILRFKGFLGGADVLENKFGAHVPGLLDF